MDERDKDIAELRARVERLERAASTSPVLAPRFPGDPEAAAHRLKYLRGECGLDGAIMTREQLRTR